MPLRFRRSIRILPGLRLNLGKRGVSTSFGIRGMHVTLGHGKVRETVGLPGTGLSYTTTQGTHQTHEEGRGEAPEPTVPAHRHVIGILVLAGLVWFLVHLVRAGGAS